MEPYACTPLSALTDTRLDPGARIVYAIMLNIYHITGKCDPSQQYIAKMAGISVPSVKRHIAKLTELGYLKKSRTGMNENNSYTPLIDLEVSKRDLESCGKSQNDTSGNGGSIKMIPPEVSKRDLTRDQIDPYISNSSLSNLKEKENIIKETQPDSPEIFPETKITVSSVVAIWNSFSLFHKVRLPLNQNLQRKVQVRINEKGWVEDFKAACRYSEELLRKGSSADHLRVFISAIRPGRAQEILNHAFDFTIPKNQNAGQLQVSKDRSGRTTYRPDCIGDVDFSGKKVTEE